MKKSEMEWHAGCLREASAAIELKLRQRPIDLSVFDDCVGAFEHIVPSLRLRAKECPDSTPDLVPAYRAIESYAPAFFAHDAIDAMYEHITTSRYLKKPEFPFLEMARRTQAREQEALALWNWIERNPGGEQRLLWREAGVDRSAGISTLDQWVESGVVIRVPLGPTYMLSFTSDLSAPIVGMCPNCGVTGKARRESLYEHRECQRCGAGVFYHLVQTPHT